MTTTITAGDGSGTTTRPQLVEGYETARQSRNVVHDLIGGGIAVSLIPAHPRAGTLSLFYVLEDDAWAALSMFARPTTFSLSSTDRPGVNMVFAAADGATVDLSLDDDTRDQWHVAVNYQEVVGT